MSRSLFALSLSAFAGSAAVAQDGDPNPFRVFPVDRAEVDMVDNSWSGRFGAVAAGNFDSDHVPDAFVLRGGTLLYVNDLAIDALTTVVGTGFTDIATLKGTAGSADRCVSVGSNGLRIWRFDEAAALTSSDNATAITSTLLTPNAGPWANASTVRCADLNGDGIDDIIGLSSDKLTVATMLSTSTPGTYSVGAARDLGETPSSLSCIKFSSTSARNYAISDALGVAAYNPLNQSATSESIPLAALSYPFMTNFRSASSSERLVAMTASIPVVGQAIFIANATAIESTIWLDPLIGGISAEPLDIDLDGDQDLALNVTSSSNVLVMLQDPNASPTFSVQSLNRFWIVVPADGQNINDLDRTARISAIDIEGDGDPDIVHGDDQSQSLTMILNPIRTQSWYKPNLIELYYLNISEQNQLQVYGTFDRGAGIDPSWNHIALTVFQRQNANQPANPDAIVHQVTPVSVTSIPAPIANVPFTLPETAVPFTNHYILVARYVHMEDEVEVASGPAAVFDLDLSTAIINALQPQATAGHPILTPGVIPLPTARGVFAKPTAKGTPTTVNPQN